VTPGRKNENRHFMRPDAAFQSQFSCGIKNSLNCLQIRPIARHRHPAGDGMHHGTQAV
jgi:hypothetical protein